MRRRGPVIGGGGAAPRHHRQDGRVAPGSHVPAVLDRQQDPARLIRGPQGLDRRASDEGLGHGAESPRGTASSCYRGGWRCPGGNVAGRPEFAEGNPMPRRDRLASTSPAGAPAPRDWRRLHKSRETRVRFTRAQANDGQASNRRFSLAAPKSITRCRPRAGGIGQRAAVPERRYPRSLGRRGDRPPRSAGPRVARAGLMTPRSAARPPER